MREELTMKPLSKLASAVQASTTLAIDTKFKELKAQGLDVLGFGVGEPDFPTPDSIKAAGIQAIRDNFTKYTPTPGIPELRQAVCRRLKEDCGLDYTPANIVAANGAKQALYAALRALLDPEDEVIVPAPYWVTYRELVAMMGAVPIPAAVTEEEQFKLTAEKLASLITPKTKVLLLNSPSNPTGMVYSREELEALAKVCVENDLYVVADEIYYRLVYDGLAFTSFAALGEEVKARTVLINGVSKSYAMTGWRLGYAAAAEPIAKVMSNYLSHAASAPCSISQKAAVEALAGPQDQLEVMRRAFEERRNYLVDRLNAIPQVSCLKPQGAFYVMMNLSQLLGKTLYGVTVHDADDFCQLFLEKALVATVPCTGFGAPNFVRWSYATGMETIKEGLDRLESFLKG